MQLSLRRAIKVNSQLRFRQRSVPAAALLLCLLSFGPLIPWLGFYWDDWPVILAIRQLGVGSFWDFYRFERPFSAWTYILTAPVLGTQPVVWHVFTLLLRWLTILGVWWSLRGLWPQRQREVSWMALLFAVYPVFAQQSVSVAFSQHWICFALFTLSLGSMIYAVRNPRRFWPLQLLALSTAALHAATMEYFLGLELLRPAVLWLIASEHETQVRERLRFTLKRWLPFLAVLTGVVVWRLFFLNIPGEDPNRPDLLYSLASQPVETILRLIQIGIQDLVNNLAGAWYMTVEPQELNLLDRSVAFSIALAVLTAGLMIAFLSRLQAAGNSHPTSRWIRQALFLGLLGSLLGPLPVWLTDRQAIFGLYSGRFALAGMFGLSILLVALLEWFTPRRLPKIILIGVLIGAAAGFHVRTATSYYRSWVRQNDFYWQLFWRAPHITPGTAILSADELFLYVGRAATATAINLLYPQPQGSTQMGYWFLELYHDVGPLQTPKLARGKTLTQTFRNFSFSAYSLDSLVIFYKPAVGRCLWVLSPQDADNSDLPELTVSALPVSNLSRIEPVPAAEGYPPVEIFGREPHRGWCYYFQKADLARQMGDWQSVARLGDDAEQKGYTPASAHEWLPFIEGYTYAGQWEKALDRTQRALDLDETISPRLCRVWSQLQENAALPDEATSRIDQLKQSLACTSSP